METYWTLSCARWKLSWPLTEWQSRLIEHKRSLTPSIKLNDALTNSDRWARFPQNHQPRPAARVRGCAPDRPVARDILPTAFRPEQRGNPKCHKNKFQLYKATCSDAISLWRSRLTTCRGIFNPRVPPRPTSPALLFPQAFHGVVINADHLESSLIARAGRSEMQQHYRHN